MSKRVIAVLALSFIFTGIVQGYELRLRFDGVSSSEKSIFTHVRIKNKLPAELVNYVREGVKISINFHIEFKSQSIFPDEVVRKIYVNKIVYYDIWNEIYVVEEKGRVLFSDENIANVLEFIEYSIPIYVCPKDEIEPNKKYYFKTRLTIQFMEVHPHLNIFFNLLMAMRYRVSWIQSKTIPGSELVK